MILGRDCFAHPEHEDVVPLEIHHVRPLARGGGQSQAIQLCANAHRRVHLLLDEIEDAATVSPHASIGEILRSLPENTYKIYGVSEKAIAFRGWEAYGLGFLNGRYVTHYRLWRTDGVPKLPDTPMFSDLGHAALWSRRWRRALGSA